MSIANPQTLVIPDRYAKMGVRQGFQPTPPDRLRMAIGGLYGKGKSTFVASIPGALILDFDCASNNVYSSRAFHVQVTSWETYETIKAQVFADKLKGDCPFTRVVFDPLDAFLMPLVDLHVLDVRRKQSKSDNASIFNVTTITEYGQEGMGYRILRAELIKELRSWFNAGFPWVITYQMKATKEAEARYPLMAPSALGLVLGEADLTGYVHSKPVLVTYTETKRINPTKVIEIPRQKTEIRFLLDILPENALTDEKRRILGLNESIPLPPVDGWASFVEKYEAAIARLNAGDIQLQSSVVAPAPEPAAPPEEKKP